jgi:hypothetical protein
MAMPVCRELKESERAKLLPGDRDRDRELESDL